MKLDTLVLLCVCVLGGMVAVFWLAVFLLAAIAVPFAWLATLPAGIAGYVIWRLVRERLTAEEDHYDRMDH